MHPATDLWASLSGRQTAPRRQVLRDSLLAYRLGARCAKSAAAGFARSPDTAHYRVVPDGYGLEGDLSASGERADSGNSLTCAVIGNNANPDAFGVGYTPAGVRRWWRYHSAFGRGMSHSARQAGNRMELVIQEGAGVSVEPDKKNLQAYL